MNQENQIIKINSNLSIQRVSNVLNLTDKLINSDESHLISYDPAFYSEQEKIEKLIIDFIKDHFWYFLSDIKKKYLVNDFGNKKLSTDLLEKIKKENKKNIEFPYAEHRTRGGGGYGYGIPNWNKMSTNEKEVYHNRVSLFDNEIKKTILSNLTPLIIGSIFSQFIGTSIGQVIGIKLKKTST